MTLGSQVKKSGETGETEGVLFTDEQMSALDGRRDNNRGSLCPLRVLQRCIPAHLDPPCFSPSLVISLSCLLLSVS